MTLFGRAHQQAARHQLESVLEDSHMHAVLKVCFVQLSETSRYLGMVCGNSDWSIQVLAQVLISVPLEPHSMAILCHKSTQ